MKKYNRLEYVGQGLGAKVGIYPTFKEVLIDRKTPYYFDNKFDVVNQTAIEYYRSLRVLDVVLKAEDEEAVEVVVKDKIATSDAPAVETTPMDNSDEFIQPPVEPTAQEDPVADDTENTEDTTSDDNAASDAEADDQTAEEPTEDLNDAQATTSEELTEFLDVTYDEEGIKNLAKELNVSFRANSSKGTIINKIIDNAPDAVLELMNQ